MGTMAFLLGGQSRLSFADSQREPPIFCAGSSSHANNNQPTETNSRSQQRTNKKIIKAENSNEPEPW